MLQRMNLRFATWVEWILAEDDRAASTDTGWNEARDSAASVMNNVVATTAERAIRAVLMIEARFTDGRWTRLASIEPYDRILQT